LTFSGNKHALLWFTMYSAKLKARLEGRDVAGIQKYFFFASFDNKGSLGLLFSFHHLRGW